MSSNSNFATSSIDGNILTISPVSIGKTAVTVKEGNGNKATTIDINVVAAPITLCKIADIPAQTYTGSAFTPDLTVTYGNITLTKGTDYTVTYSNNTNAGTATATVTCKGNYTGTTTKNFTINRQAIATVPSQNGTLTYSGSAQSPNWNNYDTNKMTIGGTYQNQTNAGTYTATFTPTSNYCWSDNTTTAKNVTWKIGKTTGSGTVSMAVWIAGNTASDPVTSTSTNGTAIITYKVQGADDSTYTSDKPTAAGNYTVRAVFAATTNYYEYTTTADFTIQAALYSINSGSPTYHTTLSSAVNSCNPGGTITVLANTSNEGALTISKNLTINTSGKTLTRTGRLTLASGCTHTINGGGTITTSNCATLTVNGTATISGNTTIQCSQGSYNACTFSGVVTLSGCRIYSKDSHAVGLAASGQLKDGDSGTTNYLYDKAGNSALILYERKYC